MLAAGPYSQGAEGGQRKGLLELLDKASQKGEGWLPGGRGRRRRRRGGRRGRENGEEVRSSHTKSFLCAMHATCQEMIYIHRMYAPQSSMIERTPRLTEMIRGA